MWKVNKLLNVVRTSGAVARGHQTQLELGAAKFGDKNSDERFDDENKKDCGRDRRQEGANNFHWFFEKFGWSAAVGAVLNLAQCPYRSQASSTKEADDREFNHLSLFPTSFLYERISTGATFSVLPRGNLPAHPTPSSSRNFKETSVQTENTENERENFGSAKANLLGAFENVVGVDLLRRGLRTESFQHFARSADMDNPNGAYNLGLCYLKGFGARPNPEKALKCFYKAADLGSSSAKYQLGVGHLRGLFKLAKNQEKAFSYFSDAAENGLPQAQTILGARLYKIGDLENSRRYLKSAADAGEHRARRLFGKLFDGNRVKFAEKQPSTREAINSSNAKFWTGNEEEEWGSESSSEYSCGRNDEDRSNGSSIVFEQDDSDETVAPKMREDELKKTATFLFDLIEHKGELNGFKKSRSCHEFHVKDCQRPLIIN